MQYLEKMKQLVLFIERKLEEKVGHTPFFEDSYSFPPLMLCCNGSKTFKINYMLHIFHFHVSGYTFTYLGIVS